jgi:hypothetical protein
MFEALGGSDIRTSEGFFIDIKTPAEATPTDPLVSDLGVCLAVADAAPAERAKRQ